MPIQSPFLTTRETAEYLKIPLPRAAIIVRAKHFPAIQFGEKQGTHWRIHKDRLDEWIKEYPGLLFELQSPIKESE